MSKLPKRLFSAVLASSMLLGGFSNLTYAKSAPYSSADDEIVLKTVFDAPSNDWESQCTQLGNGFLGAMIYGGYSVDQIQLNENSIWWGGPVGQEGYPGGNSGTASDHYNNLSKLRDYLQGTMADFTANKSAYLDANGNVVSNDYPDLSTEAQGWLNSLKGQKTYFGNYQPMGDLYTADYLPSEMRKTNNASAVSLESGNTTAASIIDGDTATDWQSTNTDMPVSLTISYDEPTTFGAYKITSSSSRASEGNAPQSWALYGSTDGENYTLIDEQSNIEFANLGASMIFGLDSEVTYQHLKLEVRHAAKNGSIVKISELSVMSMAEFNAETAVYSDYRRVLDMNNSIATVSYNKNDIHYEREYFMSNPNNFMGMRLTTDTDNALDKYIYLGSVHDIAQFEAEVRDNVGIITMSFVLGSLSEREKVACQLRIIADEGATVSYDASNPKYIHVENADDIKVYMSAGTNYKLCMDDTFDYLTDENPLDKVAERLDYVQKQDYDALKSAHIDDFRQLFARVDFQLNGASFPDYMTTKELVQGYKAGTNTDAENRYLEMLYYQMGRYLLISCSREGSLPANLQGLWNNSTNPPWKCGYTTNVNAEMNYWLAETTNLSECHEPLTTFIKAQVPRGRQTAQLYHYNVDKYEQTGEFEPARGWTCYHNLNIWGNTAPDKSSCFYFPTAAAWLCQHIWEHYAFTLDKDFLEDNFYVMKEAALFWVDNLVTDERDNTLVSAPGHSPEHGGITMGTTGDQVIIWELFNDTLKAAEALNISDSEIDEIKDAMSRLSLPRIGLAGQFQEWKDEVTLDISGHNGYKHVTHLFAVYPGSFVVPGRSEQDDKYNDAIRESLEVRGDGGTGWGKAWKIGLWARVQDGERAGDMVKSIIDDSTMFNLFDTHTPFQIDGNFGATAGMTEMVLQSEGDSIELMPAVPSKWKSGNVTGLRARGAVTVDVNWSDNSIDKAVFVSDADNDKLSVSYPKIAEMKLYDSENNEVEFTSSDSNVITFAAKANEKYTLCVSAQDDGLLKSAVANKANGKITSAVLTFNQPLSEKLYAYYAVYDGNGSLLGIGSAAGEENTSEITVFAPDFNTDGKYTEKLFIWNKDMIPVMSPINANALTSVDTGKDTDSQPHEGYLLYEDFENIRGDWDFDGKERTYISDGVLKFGGGGAGEIDTKLMSADIANADTLQIDFDWRSDVALSSSGRSAVFELLDKNNRALFGLYSNTKSSEGIKYTTSKNAYEDDDLAYIAFPVYQSKNSDWYHISLTVDFADGKITEGTVTRNGNTVLTLTDEPIVAKNLAKMRMIDYYSVAGMSLDNVMIKPADFAASNNVGMKKAVIKGKYVPVKSSAAAPDAVDEFGTIRISHDAALNPYKLTEFIPSYGGASTKAVKFDSGTTDYSDFDTRGAYADENIVDGDKFIAEVTAKNGDKAYYGFDVAVSDGSDEAYLETFEILNGDKNLIESFVFTKDTEAGGNYGSAEVLKSVDKVKLDFSTSDERLTKGEDTGLGGFIVTVNDSEYGYDRDTGEISLDEGDNIVKIIVTSYDGSTTGAYTFNVIRSGYVYIEKFESADAPEVWYSQYTTVSVTEDGTLSIDQGGGSGPRMARGWIFDSSPLVSDKIAIEFDLQMTAGNNANGESSFFIVGGNPNYKGNTTFDYNGGIIGITLPGKAKDANTMNLISGSGDTANPTRTTISNPSGDGFAFPWAHISLVIDYTTKQTTVKITDKNDADAVWYEGTVDGFIDSSVENLKGFQLVNGRANSVQQIDNIKVKPY